MGAKALNAITSDDLDRACKILIERGRVYTSQGRYISIKVFTKDKGVASLLKKLFRGNYYAQGLGLVWTLGDKRALEEMADTLRPHRKPFDKLDALFDWADLKRGPLE